VAAAAAPFGKVDQIQCTGMRSNYKKVQSNMFFIGGAITNRLYDRDKHLPANKAFMLESPSEGSFNRYLGLHTRRSYLLRPAPSRFQEESERV
jgi:hypothetical protein